MLKKNQFYQSGQVAVVVLLIMVVLLTIGLSLATRTTQELFLSDQQSESTRVFNAAESGIEQALSEVTSSGPGTLTVDGIDVTYNVTDSSTLETRISEGASVHLDLTGYSGDVDFEWSTEGNCPDRASLVANIFYDDTSVSPSVTRSKTIPFGPACDGHSDFFYDSTLPGGSPYFHSYTIAAADIPADALFMRVKPVYADTDMKVSGGNTFPTQYHVISSTATYQEGDEERNIEVSRTLPTGPAYMDYALYSGGGITQNP
jgi:hypothetical protein